MSTINERREAAQKQIENLQTEYANLQNQVLKIQQEGNQRIKELQEQQNKIVLTIEKLNGKVEVYNEEEPLPPAEVTPITDAPSAENPDAG